jgi:chorismate lyase/3-hydroxybenzoate synthase
MSNDSSNDTALIASPALDIIVSEEATTLSIQQPLLTHLYFGESDNTDQDCLSIQTELELLGSNLFAQYWFTDQQVIQAKYKNISYAHTPQMMFGLIQLPSSSNEDFQALTHKAYCEIYECLQNSSCQHLLRTWNFFPKITAADSQQLQQNRYEVFCHGRLQAMHDSGIKTKVYPAATVIGSHDSNLQVYFLASDTPGTAVENPRQTSAYHYPVEDNHTQPLFSRGLLKTWGQRTHFYVSGTASIVGHETLHIDDVCAQLNESINNVETLVAHANDKHHTQLNAQDDLLYMKVYIRHREDVEQINQVLAARLSSNTPRALLLGDMCRENLLVEIEAFYQA